MAALTSEQSFPCRVKIMTFNIFGDNYLDKRKNAIMRMLNGSKPDILVLQEVTPTILAYLDTILGDRYVSHFIGLCIQTIGVAWMATAQPVLVPITRGKGGCAVPPALSSCRAFTLLKEKIVVISQSVLSGALESLIFLCNTL